MSQSAAPWAVVTGASSGLGIELARGLAARRLNLVLVARREAPMRQLAAALEQRWGVLVRVEVLDLVQPGSALALQQQLAQRGIEPEILINNAGSGIGGLFVEQDPERVRSMLQLDIVALTELALVFGRRMAARGNGFILLVGSTAAYQPTPMSAAYGAAKAFVLSLGEALNVELAPEVGVTVLCPGLMDTGFASVSGYEPPASVRRTVIPPERVAHIGLDAMFARRSSVVAGGLNKLLACCSRLMPRHLQAVLVYRATRP
jgi:short-subunit dehydrogenase